MHTSVSYQASILLYLASESVTQFLPSSMFQQSPGYPNSNHAGAMMMPPMPSGLQMPMYSGQNLPVMMMPYHSKAADKEYNKRKKRKPKYHDFDSSSHSESCSSSDEHLRSRSGKGKKRQQVLTPVISYVTRDGTVIYQKKIKKENAGDWLELGKQNVLSKFEEREKESGEMTIGDLKYKYGLKKSHHHHNHDK